jgi:hypothetical protein
LLDVSPTERTIFRLLPYDKKFAPVKKDTAEAESGPLGAKVLAKFNSLSTDTI